jgi:multiple sugar transport system permease protein
MVPARGVTRTPLRLARPRPSPAAIRRNIWGYIFVAPAILGFVFWTLGPMLVSLGLGFTQWDMLSAPRWIGWDNYRRMVTGADPLFWQTVKVTAFYTVLTVPLVGVVASLALAIILNRQGRGVGFLRTVFYLPNVVPAVANAALWLFLYNPQWGLLNQVLGWVGLPPQQWIFDEQEVIPSLALMAMWTSSGAAMVIYLAGLQGVPQHLYEAVEIDGGGAWARFRHVTLPLITPLILFNVILTFIGVVQTFAQPYIMTQGGPNNASLFYMLYVYRVAFQQQQMGYACAMAWFLFLCVAVVSLAVFRTSRWWVYYETAGGR